MTISSLEEINNHVESLFETINQVPEEIDLDYEIIIEQLNDKLEEGEKYWVLLLKKIGGDEEFRNFLTPFD